MRIIILTDTQMNQVRGGKGITDDAAVRDYDTIDFDTVTIQEEEPPL